MVLSSQLNIPGLNFCGETFLHLSNGRLTTVVSENTFCLSINEHKSLCTKPDNLVGCLFSSGLCMDDIFTANFSEEGNNK